MIEEYIIKLQHKILELESNRCLYMISTNSQSLDDNNFLNSLREELSYCKNVYADIKLREYSNSDDILDSIDINKIEQYLRRKKLRKIKQII